MEAGKHRTAEWQHRDVGSQESAGEDVSKLIDTRWRDRRNPMPTFRIDIKPSDNDQGRLSFDRCFIGNVKIDNCTFNETRFHNCTFENVTFKDHCTFDDVVFADCQLKDVTISRCRFSAVLFSTSDWMRVQIRESAFEGLAWSGRKWIDVIKTREDFTEAIWLQKHGLSPPTDERVTWRPSRKGGNMIGGYDWDAKEKEEMDRFEAQYFDDGNQQESWKKTHVPFQVTMPATFRTKVSIEPQKREFKEYDDIGAIKTGPVSKNAIWTTRDYAATELQSHLFYIPEEYPYTHTHIEELGDWPQRLLHVPTMTSYEWQPGHCYGPSKPKPEYRAISYTWGRWKISETMLTDL